MSNAQVQAFDHLPIRATISIEVPAPRQQQKVTASPPPHITAEVMGGVTAAELERMLIMGFTLPPPKVRRQLGVGVCKG